MIRTLTIAAGLAASASAASAALTGFHVRESASLNGAASTAIAQDARVLRLFATFDGAGLIGEDPGATPDPNELTAVANLAVDATTMSLAQGSFFQETTFGTNFAPNPAAFGFVPTLRWDSYLSVGGDPVDDATAVINTAMGTTPDFVWGSNSLVGSWFNSAPGVNEFGAAIADAASPTGFSVFVGQFTVVGAGAGGDGADFFAVGGTSGLRSNPGSELLRGTFQFGVRDPNVSASDRIIPFIPTPGALALFGVAGLAAARRRRTA